MNKEKEYTIPGKEKEGLSNSFQLARIISPKNFPHKVSEIVGIPCDIDNLYSTIIKIGEDIISLRQIMDELNLIDKSSVAPHLSVGGKTTQIVRIPPSKSKPITSVLMGKASRSYLTEEYGVKGMGLIKFEKEKQTGFGLDNPFTRNSGYKDIGGGLQEDLAHKSKDCADFLWLNSYLYFGEPRFARIYKIFSYHNWTSTYNRRSKKTSFIIRDDGHRGMSRKNLFKGISQILPMMTDSLRWVEGFFEPDGHNAFFRDNKIIFTDYEDADNLSFDQASLMCKIGDKWFFEMLRKNFRLFCQMYDLTLTEENNFDIDSIKEKVKEKIDKTLLVRKNILDIVKKKINNNDNKAIVRYAMLGLISSRSLGRYIGQQIISSAIKEIMREDPYKIYTLKDMHHELTQHFTNNSVTKDRYGYDQCDVTTDSSKKLIFNFLLNTFGLPIKSQHTIEVNLFDIHQAWPYDEKNKCKLNLNLDNKYINNEFDNVAENTFSNTVYSHVAAALENIKVMNSDGGDPEEKGTTRSVEFEITNCSFDCLEINLEENIVITISPRKQSIDIKTENELQNSSFSELNMLAYKAHVVFLYIKHKNIKENVSVYIKDI